MYYNNIIYILLCEILDAVRGEINWDGHASLGSASSVCCVNYTLEQLYTACLVVCEQAKAEIWLTSDAEIMRGKGLLKWYHHWYHFSYYSLGLFRGA